VYRGTAIAIDRLAGPNGSERYLTVCGGCHREITLPHEIIEHDDGTITAVNPARDGADSIRCGYADCGWHVHLVRSVATDAM
jgi:hypothetical protein